MTTPKRPITAEDLYLFQFITDCRIAPDGREVVYSLQRVDKKTEKKHANLWLVPTAGGEPRPFTQGDQADSQPRWRPDGQEIAFLSNREDAKQPQLYLIPTGGGEARRLSDWQGSFGAVEWSPDGRWLVCQFRQKDAEEVEREKDAQKKELGIVCRHTTRLFFKSDGVGYLPKERWHLWIVDAESGAARQLTAGEVYDETAPSWSPDGQWIAFVSNRTSDPDLDPQALDLWIIPAAGGEMRRVETPVGFKELPSFSPDGRLLAYIGREGRGQGWKNNRLWVVPADSSAPARDLTGRFDFPVDSSVLVDMGAPALMPPTWSNDGRHIFFQVAWHGNSLLKSILVTGDDLQDVIEGPGVVGAYNLDAAQGKLAYLHGDLTDPCQVWLRDMAGGTAKPLTRVNAELLGEIDLGRVEEIWFKGPAGNDLQGWIVFPPDFDPSRRYPAILEIHGGPVAQYGNLMMHEFCYLAAHGYLVYFCNPRGGTGYGEAHTKAIDNAWGTVDYEDLMAWADLISTRPYIDRERLGVCGGSYGGYMTNWIIGHTQRFRAAVTMRCVSNLVTLWGASDMNWVFQYIFGDQPPWANLENYWRQSPIAHIQNARTPTLVIHNLNDMRCPVEQGEQVYVSLRKLGVDSELVLFPDEPHGLSRTGRTDRRIARLEHIRRWFDRYLK